MVNPITVGNSILRFALLAIVYTCVQCPAGVGQILLDHTAVWKQQDVSCFGGSCSYSNYTIQFIQDTTIFGQTYFQPVRSGIVTVYNLNTQMIEDEYPVIQTLSPIREEGGILYRYHSQTEIEIAVHNFDMSIGDTAVSSSCFDPQIVETIDTVYLGGAPRRRYFFAGNGTNNLIEGVGSSRGLFSQPCNGIFIESSFTLECFQQDGNVLQMDTSADCSSLVSVSVPESRDQLEVKPNPFHDRIEISFTDRTMSIISADVFNLDGRCVRHLELTDDTLSREIDLGTLTPGMYFISVRGAISVFTQRIVKI